MVPVWLPLLAMACGGSSEKVSRTEGVPDGHDAPEAELPAQDEAPRKAPPDPDVVDDEELAVFDDPGCPDESEPIEARTCDPIVRTGECPTGWDCFPYVDYPQTSCGSEVYGTRCEPAGTAVQGDSCEGVPCAGGFLCVATGQGTQCAQLCELPGDNSCPPGLICGSVDIKGFGVCF